MFKVSLVLMASFFVASPIRAEIIRKECQTEDSRMLRLTSEAIYRAAKNAEPPMCNGCSMPAAQYDIMRATAERFRSEALLNLLKARALEAAHCPQIERAIMDLGPATAKEADAVATEFERNMKKEYERFAAMKQWQLDHPQCKHVTGWIGSGGGSKEDFSGNFEGKKGQCSSDSKGEWWRGIDDDLTMVNPDTNPLIAKVQCGNALSKFGLGEGQWSYADPKLCVRGVEDRRGTP